MHFLAGLGLDTVTPKHAPTVCIPANTTIIANYDFNSAILKAHIVKLSFVPLPGLHVKTTVVS